MIKVGLAFVGVILFGPMMALAMVMLSLGALVEALSNPLNPEPSEFALEDIPPLLLDHYRTASLSCPGLPWTVVAAIGKVETNHGRFGGAEMTANGDVLPPILGPLLDGSTPGTTIIALPPGGSP